MVEALDYTPALQAAGGRCTVVNTCMAYHQGMTLVALANVLLGSVVQRWSMTSAHVQAVASLLHERAPREVSRLFEPPAGPRMQLLLKRAPVLLRHVQSGQHAVEPTQLLSNGRYNVALRANGAGSNNLAGVYRPADARSVKRLIRRLRDDALRDACCNFFCLRRSAGAVPVSALCRSCVEQRSAVRMVCLAEPCAPCRTSSVGLRIRNRALCRGR